MCLLEGSCMCVIVLFFRSKGEKTKRTSAYVLTTLVSPIITALSVDRT